MSLRISRLIPFVALAAVLAAPLSTYAASAEERMQNAVDTRQGLLKVVRAYFGPMVAMARGDMPYDADKMKEHAHKVRELSGMLTYVFQVDTRESGIASGSLDEVWENWDDFEKRAANLTKAAAALEAATAEGQGAAMAAFRATGGACKGCHDNFRQQD